MSGLPAVKRRKLSPSYINGKDLTGSKPESATIKSTFYQNASTWNLEQHYETKPRKGKKNKKERVKLPYKTDEGIVEQEVEVEEGSAEEAESDLEWMNGAPKDIAVQEVIEKPTVSVRNQILKAKEELARIALMLNEEPEENPDAFKALAQIAQTKNTTIKKLAIAVQLTVYKDVIPGYRIRALSDEDIGAKVSKDVRRIRNYEQALVLGYQGYIRELAKLAWSGRRPMDKSGGPGLDSMAISCACSLLVAVPHFNFRGDLLKILVGKLSSRKVNEDFIKCRDAIETLFQDDENGTPSLDAVALITRMMKSRSYRVDESVLNTFLHLRLLSEFSGKASQNQIDNPNIKDNERVSSKNSKEKKVFRTKKQRKEMKEQKVLDKEMAQADAAVDHEERDRMQAETLKLVFVAYFRILKLRSSNLMGAVLEGLARYAHLINQNFFGDILEALKDLIGHATTDGELNVQDGDNDEQTEAESEDAETARNLTRESLLCIITAFALLEGQDAHNAQSTLSLDLSFFTTHLYRTLHALALNPDIERSNSSLHLPDPSLPSASSSTKAKVNVATTTVLLLRSLTSILTPPQAARAVPPLRIAAFTKQLMTISLHLPEKSAAAVLGLLGQVMKVQGGKVAGLWDTEERRGDGVFDALSGEVEGSNPLAGTVWEGEMLKKHFCPGVREGVKGLERGVMGVRK